jgi:hypothetical protein
VAGPKLPPRPATLPPRPAALQRPTPPAPEPEPEPLEHALEAQTSEVPTPANRSFGDRLGNVGIILLAILCGVVAYLVSSMIQF